MADSRKFKSGKYLKAEHVTDSDKVYEIVDVREEDLTNRTGRSEQKLVLYFDDDDTKPLPLNSTNITFMEKLTKSTDTDQWIGVEVGLYIEQTPMGPGIRLRAPVKAASEPKPNTGKAHRRTMAQEEMFS